MGRLDESQVQLTGLYASSTLVTGDSRGGDASVISSIRNNLVATAAPTGSASFAAGYYFGSIWIWGTRIWDCVGDAVWQERPGPYQGAYKTIYVTSNYSTGTGSQWGWAWTNSNTSSQTYDPEGRFTNTSTTRLYIYEPGLYRLSYSMGGYCNGNQGEFFFFFSENDTSPNFIDGASAGRYWYGTDDNFTLSGERFYRKTDSSEDYFILGFYKSNTGTNIVLPSLRYSVNYEGPI